MALTRILTKCAASGIDFSYTPGNNKLVNSTQW